MRRRRADPEGEIQREIVARLRLARVVFCHVPNSGKFPVQYRTKLKAMGLEAGMPDLLVFSLANSALPPAPMALELKAPKGRLSAEQTAKLAQLRAVGWRTAVTYGPDQALAQLVAWGVL